MEHNWGAYFDTESEYWSKLQKIYKENDDFPKVVVSDRNLHHKFMRSFSKLEGTPVDNDKDNLVSLSLPDHLRVHFYLWKCTKTGFRNRTAAPVRFMLKKALSHVTEKTIEQIIEDWDYSYLHSKMSEETKKKISEKSKGHMAWNKGKKGLQKSPRKGKHLSEEHKRKIKEAKKNSHSKGMTGLKHSEQTIGRMRDIATKSRGKSVECIELSKCFSSISEAARFVSTTPATLSNNIHLQRKCKGYHWRFV